MGTSARLIEINGHQVLPQYQQLPNFEGRCAAKTFHPPPPPPQDVQSIKICLINNLGEHVLGLVGAIRNICFPLFHMENVYIQYNFPIPILLPVSMNHLVERRGQMLARVPGFLQSVVVDKFSCRRFVNLYGQICQP